MAALEVLRDVAAEGTPPVTVALVDWADEEGARFGRSLFGSSAAAGTLDPDAVRDLVDAERPAARGRRARARGRARPRARGGLPPRERRAYLELHIEQGPVLEGEGLAVGTVLGTVGVERHRLIFDGPGSARGLDPDRPAARLVPRGRALRARAARGRAPPPGRVHRWRRALRARGRHGGPRADDAARRPAQPRRGRARRDARGDADGRARAPRRPRAARSRSSTSGASSRSRSTRRSSPRPRTPAARSRAPTASSRAARCTTRPRWPGACPR